jgi:hypothetical protein
MEDYIGTPTKVNTNITGVGQAKATYVGTAKWLIVNDQGRKHELLVPGTRFQKDPPFCLLSPQHVAQVYNDPQSTCFTLMDKVIFEWGKGKWRRTLPLHQSSNVALMWPAPGYKKFYAIAAQYMPAHIIPDDDDEEELASNDDDSISESTIQPSQLEEQTNDDNLPMTTMSQREQPIIIEFSDNVDQQQIKTPTNVTYKQAALRRCHERLNHMPFSRLQSMAKQGLLPRYFADVEAPMCASCAYGKATQHPWRTKGAQGQTTKLVPIRRSGDCVSVDQMESPTPGFVGQIKDG